MTEGGVLVGGVNGRKILVLLFQFLKNLSVDGVKTIFFLAKPMVTGGAEVWKKIDASYIYVVSSAYFPKLQDCLAMGVVPGTFLRVRKHLVRIPVDKVGSSVDAL